jgi:hypothetical protein
MAIILIVMVMKVTTGTYESIKGHRCTIFECDFIKYVERSGSSKIR